MRTLRTLSAVAFTATLLTAPTAQAGQALGPSCYANKGRDGYLLSTIVTWCGTTSDVRMVTAVFRRDPYQGAKGHLELRNRTSHIANTQEIPIHKGRTQDFYFEGGIDLGGTACLIYWDHPAPGSPSAFREQVCVSY